MGFLLQCAKMSCLHVQTYYNPFILLQRARKAKTEGGGGDKRRIGGGIHEWGRGVEAGKKLVKTMMKGNLELGPYSNLCQSGGMYIVQYSSSTLPIIQHSN